MNTPAPLAVAVSQRPRSLAVGFAGSFAEIREAQRLRYQIFANEMRACLHTPLAGLDYDHFDAFCRHLLVRDNATGQVIGYTRLLTAEMAQRAGGFYSQTEFEIDVILRLPGRFVEVGRTCIHPAYRTGATITVLWSGVAAFVVEHGCDYLIGCASIPLGESCRDAQALYAKLAARHLLAAPWRVRPYCPLPPIDSAVCPVNVTPPPLLKAYLRLGAKIGGEPHLDAAFQAADLFILLPTREIEQRYARHFLGGTG